MTDATTREKLKEELLEAYQDEVTSGLNYLAVGTALEGLFGDMIGDDLQADFAEELTHAEEIAETLDVVFDEVPPTAPDIDVERQPYLDDLGGAYTSEEADLLEVCDAVIQAESEAVERYQRIAELAMGLNYADIEQMAAGFIKEEQRHLDEMESAREQFTD